MLTTDALTRWCQSSLQSSLAETLFERGNLSYVVGVTLEDERQVVIKIRPWQNRLSACVAVQRQLALAGYPCPAPLTNLDRVDAW
ncbi:MAG TPA: hypothetical protein VMU74_01425, partial [Gaiellaceae bacterium]|nr:hypothetical protein [Gaiellaceae bacterium]